MKVKVKSLSRVRLFATPWTVAHQAPLSMGFTRKEYWSGLPFPSPEDHPDPEIEPRSPALQADALTSEPPRKPDTEPLAKIHEPYPSNMEIKSGQSDALNLEGDKFTLFHPRWTHIRILWSSKTQNWPFSPTPNYQVRIPV